MKHLHRNGSEHCFWPHSPPSWRSELSWQHLPRQDRALIRTVASSVPSGIRTYSANSCSSTWTGTSRSPSKVAARDVELAEKRASGFGGPVTASWYFTTIDPKAPKDYYTGTDGRKTTFSGQSPAAGPSTPAATHTRSRSGDRPRTALRTHTASPETFHAVVPGLQDLRQRSSRGTIRNVAHANTKASWTCSTRLDRIQ